MLHDLIIQHAKAYDAGCKRRPGITDHLQPVVSLPQPSQPLQPSDRALHDPADLS